VQGAVPIAALLWDDGEWVVDTWIARRDIGGPPSRTAWEGRLGLRPWNVFLAQVLQFQAQLADVLKSAVLGESRERPAEVELLETLDEKIQHLQPKRNAGRGAQQNALDAVAQIRDLIVDSMRGVVRSAFVELPPAGVIPLPRQADPAHYFRELFGASLPIDVEHTRTDCALRELEDAQHLDRIRLAASGEDSFVRLLVPIVGAGVYDRWMVFTRGCCPPDYVEVYVSHGDDDLNPDKGPEDSPEWTSGYATTLRYPRRAWSLPGPDNPMTPILEKIGNRTITEVIGYANAEDRRSLALVRSQLIVFDLQSEAPPNSSVRLTDGNEAILIRTRASDH
jgi:hypothetical protein